MNFILMARGLCSAAAAATLSIACATIALAETITVTDIIISQ